MSGGLVVALVAGSFILGFLLGFVWRSRISQVRRRRWRQMIADGVMPDPTTPLKSPEA